MDRLFQAISDQFLRPYLYKALTRPSILQPGHTSHSTRHAEPARKPQRSQLSPHHSSNNGIPDTSHSTLRYYGISHQPRMPTSGVRCRPLPSPPPRPDPNSTRCPGRCHCQAASGRRARLMPDHGNGSLAPDRRAACVYVPTRLAFWGAGDEDGRRGRGGVGCDEERRSWGNRLRFVSRWVWMEKMRGGLGRGLDGSWLAE